MLDQTPNQNTATEAAHEDKSLVVRQTDLVSKEQMDLEIPRSKWDGYYEFKRRLNRTEVLFEALPYWKNFATVASLVTSIALVAFVSFLILYFFKNLPSEIPLIFNQSKNSWELISKDTLIAAPVALGLFLLVVLRLNRLSFNFDRRLSYVTNIATILFNVLAAIAFAQLFALVLIY